MVIIIDKLIVISLTSHRPIIVHFPMMYDFFLAITRELSTILLLPMFEHDYLQSSHKIYWDLM